MKKAFLLLLIASTVAIAKAQSEKEPWMTKSLSAESIQSVKARTSGGSISVSGVNASEAKIEVYIESNNNREPISKEEIRSRLENYDLDISVADHKLTAIAKSKDRDMNWKRSLSISFKIYIPQNTSTNLATSGGSIHLDNLQGTEDFETSGGSLHVDKVGGKITGRTSGGSIHLANSKDQIDLETSGGSITAENSNGNMTLNTSGGSLNLTNLQGTIKAATSGGSVHGNDIKGELAAHTSGGSVILHDLACSVETSTSGGSMDVEIKELGKYVRVSNSGGNIALSMPGNKGVDLRVHADKIRIDALNNFSGTKSEGEIDGKMNGGGIPVTVKAGSGRVNMSLH